jgi:hypothetical protein
MAINPVEATLPPTRRRPLLSDIKSLERNPHEHEGIRVA